MRTTIIPIGNSKGVRIPKVMLAESGLDKEVELRAKPGEIRIVPAPPSKTSRSAKLSKKAAIAEAYALSRSALAREWEAPEEDEAWRHLQSAA